MILAEIRIEQNPSEQNQPEQAKIVAAVSSLIYSSSLWLMLSSKL